MAALQIASPINNQNNRVLSCVKKLSLLVVKQLYEVRERQTGEGGGEGGGGKEEDIPLGNVLGMIHPTTTCSKPQFFPFTANPQSYVKEIMKTL